MGPVNKTIKKTAIFILKFSVSATLFYILISKIGGNKLIENLSMVSPIAFIAAIGIYLISSYLSSLRWKLLIPKHMKTKKVFAMNMIGAFFNTCMPGIVGGDAVKAYYLSRELKKDNTSLNNKEQSDDKNHSQSQSRFAENIVAIASVFTDRYIGFSALLLISITAFPFGFKYLEGTPVKWLMPLILVIFVSVSIAIFKFRIGERLKFLLKAYEYFRLYSAKKNVLFKAFLYSLCVQISGFISVYILSKGLSLDISFLSLLIFLPIIILISLIPVSISGIGLREGAFVFLLSAIGIAQDKSLALSLLWFLSVVVASLWGLFEYLRYKVPIGKETE